MSSNNSSNRQKPIDPLLAQRLEALSRRKGAPLPPPAAAARAASTPASAGVGTARPGQKPIGTGGKRVKPARGAKAASLALSVVTTGALTALFAQSQGTSDSVQLVAGTASASLTPGAAPAVVPAASSAVTTPVVAPAAAPVTAAPVTAAPAQQQIGRAHV